MQQVLPQPMATHAHEHWGRCSYGIGPLECQLVQWPATTELPNITERTLILSQYLVLRDVASPRLSLVTTTEQRQPKQVDERLLCQQQFQLRPL